MTSSFSLPLYSTAQHSRARCPVAIRLLALASLSLLQVMGASHVVMAQTTPPPQARPRIMFDLSQGQTFFSAVPGKETPLQRSYQAIGDSLGIEITTSAVPLTAASLAGVQTVVLMGPQRAIEPATIEALVTFVKNGGALLLGIDEERRQSAGQTRISDIATPLGLTFTGDTPYIHNRGAVALAGRINPASREIPYSGGRAVEGGTPLSFVLAADGSPSTMAHSAWVETPGGGRVVAMGDLMVPLLLGRPEGPRLGGGLVPGDTIYFGKDSRAFMTEVLSWLTYRLR